MNSPPLWGCAILLAVAHLCSGQVTQQLFRASLTSGSGAADTQIVVSGAIPFIPDSRNPGSAYVDAELLKILSVQTTGTFGNVQANTVLTVQRGQGGTAATQHNSGALIYAGYAYQFITTTPSGACSPGSANLLNYNTAAWFSCEASVWVSRPTSTGGGGGTGTVTSITASAPLTGGTITASGSIGCQVASGSQAGCLSAADYSAFTGKQTAGNYITALTGDGAASGPGSAAFTLATVNPNVGGCGDATHVGQVTLNAKGLTTGCTAVAITGAGGGATLETNGVSNTSQSVFNLQNSAAVNGLTISFTNPSAGNVQAGLSFTSGVTGTGAFVLATSPTLVTPALGTPSALVLTNATALPGGQITGANSVPASTLPLATTGAFGAVKPDGSSITITSGVISSTAGAGPFSTITSGTNAGQTLTIDSGSVLSAINTGQIYATNLARSVFSGLPTASAHSFESYLVTNNITATLCSATSLFCYSNGVNWYEVSAPGGGGSGTANHISSGLLASIPGTCAAGDVYFATDQPAGEQLYQCSATNTFTQTFLHDTTIVNTAGSFGVNLSQFCQFTNSCTVAALHTFTPGTKITPTVVGSLGTCNGGTEGRHWGVTDASTTIALGIGTTVIGGGANHVPVYCDGTNWVID